ncbi:MAG: cytochrome c [Myxococcota bacterium]|nr:cytochrome c [Myxococcota bacterium]
MRSLLIASCLMTACKSDTNSNDTGDPPPADTADTGTTEDTEDTEDKEPQEETGESLFKAFCAGCHAPDGSGTPSGPPIVYVVKQQDEAYLLDVILSGTGNMDPIDVTAAQAQLIVDFLQSDSF